MADARGGPGTAAALQAAWDRVKARLRAEFGEDVYQSWLARLELEGVAAGTAELSVPTRFLKSWISHHYMDRIAALFAGERSGIERITLVVRSAGTRQPSAAGMAAPGASAGTPDPVTGPAVPQPPILTEEPRRAGEDPEGSPLDRRLTFQTFVVGRSNQLAFAAGLEVVNARAGAPAVYNPLYVHAAVGLGKTHLLQAIAQGVEATGRRVLYLTAERFMYGFVAALKGNTAIAFKERLRGIDVLVIDDLQFLQGRSIQQEFCHTLNALIDGARQVIVAADRPPGDLESLDERVRSRLSGGLVVEVGALDEEQRRRILEGRIAAARARTPGFDVSAAVVTLVARLVTTNGRDLDGAVNRLIAHGALHGGPLTLEAAEAAVRDLVRQKEPKRVKIEDIQRIVAKHYNVSRADILSERRTAGVVRPRQVAMYLSKVLTPRSLPEIGRRFGGRDHTTVLHAVRKIGDLLGTDAALAEEIDLLKRILSD